jgi:parallel beta-helix repeat protein
MSNALSHGGVFSVGNNGGGNADFTDLGYYLVTDYGATGDGTTDDTEAIQAAIDAADVAGGGTVYFPPGATYLTDQLTVNANTRLLGYGAALKSVAGTTGPTSVITVAVTETDVEICGLEIDGNAATQADTNDHHGIEIGGTRLTVRDCHIHDTEGSGIYLLAGSTDITIEGNRLIDIGRFGLIGEAHETDAISNVVVRGNLVDGAGTTSLYMAYDVGGGILSAGAKQWTFVGNVVVNAGEGGISGYSPNNEGITVTGNTLDTLANHGSHWGGTDISIVGNVYRDTGNSAVALAAAPNGSSTAGSRFLIADNTISLASGGLADDPTGIHVANYTEGVISGNRIHGALGKGIYLEGNQGSVSQRCTDIVISGNEIVNSDEHGIHLIDADRITISNNLISNPSIATANTYDGIFVEDSGSGCTGLVILGNLITDANSKMRYGVSTGANTATLTAVGNVITGEQTDEMSLGGSNHTIIANEGVDNALFSALRVRSSGATGLLAQRYSNDTTGTSIIVQKTRATSADGVTIVQSGDNLGTLAFQGSDGVAFLTGARVRAAVDGTPGENDMPTRILFQTTPDGSATPADAVIIGADKGFCLVDGITAPATRAGWATIYVDTADGNLKVKFGDGFVAQLAADA